MQGFTETLQHLASVPQQQLQNIGAIGSSVVGGLSDLISGDTDANAEEKAYCPVYDVNGKLVTPGHAYHSYVKLILRHRDEHADKEKIGVQIEMAGALSICKVSTGPETQQLRPLYLMFAADHEMGRGASEQKGAPFERQDWRVREGLTIKEFFEGSEYGQGLYDLVKLAVNQPEMKKRGASWKHPWDPALYNCQHLSGHILGIATPGVTDFYERCLMHKPISLNLTNNSGLFKTQVVANLSQKALSASTPDLDEWRKKLRRADNPQDWLVDRVELYWIDCTYLAVAVTNLEGRNEDRIILHEEMCHFRRQDAASTRSMSIFRLRKERAERRAEIPTSPSSDSSGVKKENCGPAEDQGWESTLIDDNALEGASPSGAIKLDSPGRSELDRETRPWPWCWQQACCNIPNRSW